MASRRDEVELVIRGRKAISNITLLDDIWAKVFFPVFNTIAHECYYKEHGPGGLMPLFSGYHGRYAETPDGRVRSVILITHNLRFGSSEKQREPGDVCLITVYTPSSPTSRHRIVFLNAFQIKVSNRSLQDALKKVFAGNGWKQYTFYREELLKYVNARAKGLFTNLTSDFIFYWLIYARKCWSGNHNMLVEIPVSALFESKDYRGLLLQLRGGLQLGRHVMSLGYDIMCRSLFAINGINVEAILHLAKGKFYNLLNRILEEGVPGLLASFKAGSNPSSKNEKGELEEQRPILLIITEILTE